MTSSRVSYSHFELEYLRELIQQIYPVLDDHDFRIRLYNNGFNVLYHIATHDGGSYIFRIRPSYRYYDLTEESVDFVLSFQQFLFDQSFPVPKIVRTKDEKLYDYIDAPEGKRFVSLHHVVDGKMVFPLNEVQSQSLGRYLATMHLLSREFNPSHKRIYFTTEQMIEFPRLLLEQHRDAYAGNQDWFEGIMQETAESLHQSELRDFVVIHGDFWHGNVLVESDSGNVSIIDFDFASYGPKELDLASFLILGLQRYVRDRDKFETVETMFYQMIDGYHKVWNDAIDMNLIYDIAVARLIWMIGGYFAVIGTHAFSAIQQKITDLTVILQQLLKIKQ